MADSAALTQPRLGALRERLEADGLDGVLVSFDRNFRFLTGFTGDAGALLVSRGDAVLLTDSRYIESAAEEARGVRPVMHVGALIEAIGEQIGQLGGKRWGFEAEHVQYAQYQRLGGFGAELVPTSGIVEQLRTVKGPDEIAAIRHACTISVQALEELFARLRPGMREWEAAFWLDGRMRELGAEGPAFEFIVASGPRGSLPHGAASDKPLVLGELITFDVGCRFLGYHSDITRTVALGTPPKQLREVYEIVLEAQRAGVAAVRAGAAASDVDKAARGVIERAGYGERFGHGTGHGVGLEIHEAPLLGARSDQLLRAGMVVTIEPGIYIAGLGGVRIEDSVLVTEDGCEVLTQSPKELRSFSPSSAANYQGGGLS